MAPKIEMSGATNRAISQRYGCDLVSTRFRRVLASNCCDERSPPGKVPRVGSHDRRYDQRAHGQASRPSSPAGVELGGVGWVKRNDQSQWQPPVRSHRASPTNRGCILIAQPYGGELPTRGVTSRNRHAALPDLSLFALLGFDR